MDNKQKEKYREYSHEELVTMAKTGDTEAEEFLIRCYKNEINAVARSYYIAGAETEDAVQEAMIGFFKAIHSYDENGGASFRTYAGVCMSRQLVSAVKAATRKKHAPLNYSVSLENTVLGEGEDGNEVRLLDIIEGKAGADPDTMAIVNDIFEYISKNGEDVFSDLEMKVWDGFVKGKSYEETAAELGKSSKAIYNAMERSKKKIIKYLEG